MCEQDQDLCLKTAPHRVDFKPPKGSSIGGDIIPWLLENGHGKFCSVGWYDDTNLDSFTGWSFHFTDPNTAFWFKLRFGGR